jgi:sugar phosphate isomerase/epimerase
LFRFAYNTNGLAHHRPLDALRLLAEVGYEGVALTPDAGFLDPFEVSRGELLEARRWADDLGLDLSVETGARFLLDARAKHRPNLMDVDPAARKRRVEFLLRCLAQAHILGADVLSLWAGGEDEGQTLESQELAPGRVEELLERLASGLLPVLERGRELGVRVAFEPEPGMFIERPAGYGQLVEYMGSDAADLGLCLDVGHLVVTGDLPVGREIERWAERLIHVHLDDALPGIHEHLMFGQGELDLAATLKALVDVGYKGLAAVELSRDSHRGPTAAGEALERLRNALRA